jgi:hypothetical protein
MWLKPDLELIDQFRYICIGNKQLKGTATVPFSFLHTRSLGKKPGFIRSKTCEIFEDGRKNTTNRITNRPNSG